MQGGLLGCPESRSQGGGLLTPGDCVPGDFATQEVTLHLPSPRLSLLRSLRLLALGTCCCCCVLPDPAGLTVPLKPEQGGSDVFLEEGHGSVVKWHEGTCTLLQDGRDTQAMPAFWVAASIPGVSLLQCAALQVGQKP